MKKPTFPCKMYANYGRAGPRPAFFLFGGLTGDEMDIEERVLDIARPLAAAEGVDLLDVRFVREGPRRVLRLTIERPGAPTALADCEAVSRAVERVLDTVDFIPERYSLEVASAGLTRPLRTLPDFVRAVGTLVRVTPREGGPVTGVLRAAGESGLTLELPGGKALSLPLDSVASARKEVDLFLPGGKR